MTASFRRVETLSSWRRIALHAWSEPRDPTVYGNLEVNMRRAIEYLDAANRERLGPRVTVTHLVVKAIARALAENPEANAIILGRWIYLRSSVDVYCQIATDGGADLSGLKVERADEKSVVTIADELAEGTRRVRDRRDPGSERTKRLLSYVPHRLLGIVLRLIGWLTYERQLDLGRFGIARDQFGAAMVSNVGSFGLGHGLAPLVPPSRAPIVLLVAEVTDRPAVEEGRLTIAPHMTIGATFDHRLIDGYQAGRMARAVIASLEDPLGAFGPPG